MTYLTWRDLADRTLAPLFADGHTPTKQELFDAYPFGMRKYTPYKIWLEQVKRWREASPLRRPPFGRPVKPAVLPGQEAML